MNIDLMVKLLAVARCPNPECDGSGAVACYDNYGQPSSYQCQWCYERSVALNELPEPVTVFEVDIEPEEFDFSYKVGDCLVETHVSRACERGTRGCTVYHDIEESEDCTHDYPHTNELSGCVTCSACGETLA